jgi:TonB family protein
MNYQISLVSFLLFILSVAAPFATAHPSRPKVSAAASPVIAAQEQTEPTTDESSAQLPTQTDTERIYKGKEVDKKPVVKSKPQPEYTKEADGRRMDGTVVLRCVFASTGKVTNIHVVGDPPDGLRQSAIDAASRIKFKPAEKDGKPVSMWIELQYKFHPR